MLRKINYVPWYDHDPGSSWRGFSYFYFVFNCEHCKSGHHVSSFEVALWHYQWFVGNPRTFRWRSDRDRFFLLPALWADTESADDSLQRILLHGRQRCYRYSDQSMFHSSCLSCSEASANKPVLPISLSNLPTLSQAAHLMEDLQRLPLISLRYEYRIFCPVTPAVHPLMKNGISSRRFAGAVEAAASTRRSDHTCRS